VLRDLTLLIDFCVKILIAGLMVVEAVIKLVDFWDIVAAVFKVAKLLNFSYSIDFI
jgi:hypothetical protein